MQGFSDDQICEIYFRMCTHTGLERFNAITKVKIFKLALNLFNYVTTNGIVQAYYRDAVGGFVVYDVTKRISFERCLHWKEEIDRAVCLKNGDPIPIVLIANKVLYGLHLCMKKSILHEQVDYGKLDGKQFSKEHDFAGYFETSAKTGAGIKEAIHFMVKKV